MRMIKAAIFTVLASTIALTAAGAAEYPVGVQLSLTGPYAIAGKGNLEGITCAVDIFNRKNPKSTIKLITIDDEASPAKAISAVEKLIAQKVVAVTGGYPSNQVGPASEVANRAKIPYVTGGGTSKELTERGLNYFFRINNSPGYAAAMVAHLKEMGVKSISVVYSTKDGTTDLAHRIEKGLSGSAKVVLHPFEPSTTDFKPIINKIKVQDKPEVIVMVCFENDYVGILRAAKVLKPDVKAMYGAYAIATPKMLSAFPDLLPNVFGTISLPHPAEFSTADGKEFAETYRRLYKKDPNDFVVQIGFVQGQILSEALKRAVKKGTINKGGLVDEIRKTNMDTILGRIAFDKTGDNPKFLMRIGQIRDNKIVLVWPKSLANGQMKYPAVPWER